MPRRYGFNTDVIGALFEMNVSLIFINHPDSKAHGANIWPIWGRQDPGGPMLAPWTLLSGNCLYASLMLPLCMKLTWEMNSLRKKDNCFIEAECKKWASYVWMHSFTVMIGVLNLHYETTPPQTPTSGA